MIAIIAVTSTAAAEISFINFTLELLPGQIISQTFSIAVLNNSAVHTIAIDTVIKSISVRDGLVIKLNIITTIVTTACTMALCCVLKNCCSPSKAK